MGFIEDLQYDVWALQPRVRYFEGLEIIPNQVGGALSKYDWVVIPGGNGVISLINDTKLLSWIKGIDHKANIAAVCEEC